MLISIHNAILKFLKELPVIKNIPGFNSLPENINTYNLRFYKLGNLVYTLGAFIHLSWVFLFWYLQIVPLIITNIVSICIYVFIIVINRKGYHYPSAAIMIIEIILHQIIAARLLGWDSGFQYYIMVTSLLPFLMPQGYWVSKSVLFVCCLISYILMDYMLKGVSPIYIIPMGFIIFLSISNILFSFTSMVISGAYFNIAMHETETELARRTEELVKAEQKATLGKLATEMAHEIQNPLNFVNNFAELNEELLSEIKEAIDKSNNEEEVAELLNDLLKNAESIKINGKRISGIVRSLQDQVNAYEHMQGGTKVK